jgi:hypothetical protein
MFKVRAYESRAAAESGQVMPTYASGSGSYATAMLVAAQLADEYGAAVVENSDTGNRVWKIKPSTRQSTRSKNDD